MAIDDIADDEQLFAIPRTAILNVETCSLVNDHPDAKAVLANMTQWEALILVIAYEWKVKAQNLPWRTYFDVLPLSDESYKSDQLIFWDKSELEQLHPSYIVNRVGHDSALGMYQRLVPRFNEYVGLVTEAEFNLIASVVMAYSFDVRNDGNDENDDDGSSDEEKGDNDKREELVKDSDTLKSMVPLADTLNADTHKHNASLFIAADRLVMRSIAKIEKSDQIFNIYSEHPNAEILRQYGYVEQNGSAHDFAEVSLQTFTKYFAENLSLSHDFIDEILAILRDIEAEEDEKFILDTYDCYASSEVIFELTFLTQLFVIIAAINHKKLFNSASAEVKARAIRRVFKKTYQLLEGRKITAQLVKSFPQILKIRLAEHPKKARRGYPDAKSIPLSRLQMALVVLASECISLQSCIDANRVFVTGEPSFGVIDDEKLLRNIMKKDTFEGSEPQPAKKKKKKKKRLE